MCYQAAFQHHGNVVCLTFPSTDQEEQDNVRAIDNLALIGFDIPDDQVVLTAAVDRTFLGKNPVQFGT